MTFRRLVLRALVAGLLAGVAMALYLFTVVEPTIDQAIAGESAAVVDSGTPHGDEAEAGHSHGDGAEAEELFTRPTQKVGGMIATALYATIVAGIFGTVFAFVRHRLPAWSEVGRVGLLAAVAFGAVVLVPTVKYPANPPGVGAPETVDQRTLQYVAVLAVSIAVAVGLFWLAGWLKGRVAPSARPALVVLAAVVAYALVLLVLPDSPDTVGDAVPAQLLWDFRIRSIGGLALLWTTLGAAFGWLLQREVEQEGAEPELARSAA